MQKNKMYLDILNDLTHHYKKYSDPLLSIAVCSYLYKGKQKNREDPNSYRKISIGTTITKIIDVYLSPHTNKIAQDSQPSSQFGFTPRM